MREKIEIDSIDRKLLQLLQQDATLSIQALALEVGLSNNPCWRRVKRLEDTGVIEKRIAVVNPKRVGLETTVFVQIKIESHTASWLSTFADGLTQIPEIMECHRMAGEVDYLLKVVVRDLSHYDSVYQTLIERIPGLQSVSSSFSMECLKHSTHLPIV